jgi:predicted PurR-regulated permease PerM
LKELLKNRAMRFILLAAGLAVFLLLFYILLDVFVLFAISVLLAFIFQPFVLLFEKQGFNRLFSVIIVFFVVGLLLYLGLSIIIPRFVFQLNHLIETLHVYSLHDQLMLLEKEIYNFIPFFTPGSLAKRVEQVISLQIIHFFEQISDVLSSLVSVIAILVIVPFITFFLLKDNRLIFRGIVSIMPNKYFEMSYWILKKITIQLGRFVRGWLFDASFVGIMCGLGFYSIGIPYALPLGVIAGFGHLVPYLGPVIGGIPAIVISIIQYGDMSHVPLIILLMIIIYTVDNGFVQPYIFSKNVDMHPIIIILLIIAGSQLFGLIGMLLAIPVASVVRTAAKEIYFAFKNYKVAQL